jgi:hypothetical protein
MDIYNLTFDRHKQEVWLNRSIGAPIYIQITVYNDNSIMDTYKIRAYECCMA